MTTVDKRIQTDQEDKPLTRIDVEQLLKEVGDSDKLNLNGFNLKGIDLSDFVLKGANLSRTDLGDANLQRADLSKADLRGANLRQATLHKATLFRTDLSWAILQNADVSEANLNKAYLISTNLSNANLLLANLSEAILFGANLLGANLDQAILNSIHLYDQEKDVLRNRGIIVPDERNEKGLDKVVILRIRITEEPLSAQNLTMIISALTELSTKYWLIAKDRFSDLIEYTQTHNGRFAEEANVVITRVSYNSPFNMDWKVDLSAPSVAEALVTTIDGITQRKERLEQAKLENLAKAREIKEVEQKSEQENQIALLEQEKLRLELEQRRLEVLEKQLEVQKKGIEYALEIASKVVDTLHPGADPATRAMEIQALLPNLVQLQNGKGLELALPTPSKSAG